MSDSLSNISDKSGMSPGSLVHIGDVLELKPTIYITDYSKDHIEERYISSIDEILPLKNTNSITWVNIEGLKDIKLIESIGQLFNIHSLVLEDILNTHQRAKFEEHDDYLYIVLKGLSLTNAEFSVNYEQISILIFKKFIFTFKEKHDDLFQTLTQRLNSSKDGRIRTLGTDYLAYAIMDTIVDQNFILLESLDEMVDAVEEGLLTNPDSGILTTIQQMKRELIYIRRSVAPLRELFSAILRSESPLIHKKIHIYFRDIYDHVLRITEAIDSYRDILTGLLDVYISSVSNKMNEVMKVLTVFASIFIPLTFIAGVYGMNFEYMPELKWKWAYPILWFSFVTITVALLVYFKRKKWL